MKFSHREKIDLFFAGIIISFAFAILFSDGLRGISYSGFYAIFGIAFITAGLGFLLHEIGHKYAAEYYKLRTEFKAFYPMLGLAVLLSFMGFIFAAPGAVFIYGTLTKERDGKISLAGPSVNLILAVLFLIPLIFIQTYSMNYSGIIESILILGVKINSLLALFNLLPIMPFDGAKVLAWNRIVYFSVGGIALILFAISLIF